MYARLTLPVSEWRQHAARAVLAYVRSEGAAVWPEIETTLANSDWYRRNVAGVPPIRGIDPHHLTFARRALVEVGQIMPQTALLNELEVVAYLDAEGLAARRRTAIERLAAKKRRAYRTYQRWTSNPRLCGQVLETQVAATLDALRGYDVLLEPAAPGQVARIGAAQVPGGPLDHAGHLLLESNRPEAGFVGFVVEDKNVRSTLYPSAQEVWDLLAKAGAFPDRVPLLITHRVHYTLLTFFKAIGAVSYAAGRQWFSRDIESRQFQNVTSVLKLRDAHRLLYPNIPSDPMTRFFTGVLRGANTADASKRLIEAYADRWARAAPICASFPQLRDGLAAEQRTELYQHVLEELDEAGLDVSDLRAHHRVETEPPELPDIDLGDIEMLEDE